MGGNSSKSAVEQTNEFFNSTTQNFMASLHSTVNVSHETIQNLTATGMHIEGCRVRFGQSVDSDVAATGQLSQENLSQLTAELKNQANTAIDNMASQHSGFLAPTIMNSADARTTLKTKVTNIVNTSMTSSAVLDVIAAVNNHQAADFTGLWMKCYPEYRFQNEWDLEVDQNIKAKIVAKAVADQITHDLTSVIADNSVTTSVKQSASQTSAGLDDLVKAIFSGWGLLVMAIIVILIILVMVGPKILAAVRGGGNGGGNGNGGGKGS